MDNEKSRIENVPVSTGFYHEIRQIVQAAKNKVYTAVDTAMVEAYWLIGKRIIEEEQHGDVRAEYGQKLIEKLSVELKSEFGKGFDVRNLRNMRSFYLTFPKRNALRTKLNWTHYRSLIRIKDSKARLWYMQSIMQNFFFRRGIASRTGTRTQITVGG